MPENNNVIFKTSTNKTINDLFNWDKSTGELTPNFDANEGVPFSSGTLYFTSDGHLIFDTQIKNKITNQLENTRLWMSKNAYSAIYAEDVAETNTDITNAIKYSIHYVEGPTTDTNPGTWTGTINGITELYDGLTIIYVPAVAGGSSTTTLNINGLGAKTCYYSNTSAITTHYSVGTPILLTYRNNCWRRADYNSNTTYSAMSVAEMRAGTATSQRSIRADYLKTFLSTLGGTNLTLTHSGSAPYLQLNHDPSGITAGTYGNNSQQNPSYGGTFNIPYFTVDTQGHITNASTTTVKIPASDNTDYKVRQTSINSNDNNNYRILLSNSANDTSEDSISKKNANLIYNPTENKLSTGNIKLTGELDVTGNVYLRNQTAVDNLTTGSLIVNGNSTFNNDINFTQGAVKWTSNSLPAVTSADYFLVIDGFANGGATKYITKANAIKSLISSSAIGSSTKPVYWTGSAFSAITSYSGAAALTGTPTAPTAAAGTSTTQIATTEFVTNAVAQGFVANDAMVFKGLIGSNQLITQLPTSGYNAGWTYRVANAGIFAGEYCEVGDLLIAIKDGPTSGSSVINTDWGKVEHNIDGAVFRGSGASNSSVGSSTQPVYVNDSGIVTAITSLEVEAGGTGENNRRKAGLFYNWTTSLQGQIWSRICYIPYTNSITGSAMILNIRHTRSGVVYNETVMITVHHNSRGNITSLSSSNYNQNSSIQIRALVNSSGNCYIELKDSNKEITEGTAISPVYCALQIITLGNDEPDLYTSFQNGTTLPENYSIAAEATLGRNRITTSGIFSGNLEGNAATASAVPWSGITNLPTTIAGYGITDAKIQNGTITLGNNTITPLTSSSSLNASNISSGTINATYLPTLYWANQEISTTSSKNTNPSFNSVRLKNNIYNIAPQFSTGNNRAKETILYTGIKIANAHWMPVLHFTGYAYGLAAPIEFKVAIYYNSNKFMSAGVTNMGAWNPEVYAFKYAKNNEDYVAIGFKGICYYLQMTVDIQEMLYNLYYIDTDPSAWTWDYVSDTDENTIIPEADGGVTCLQIPYKGDVLDPYRLTPHSKNKILATPANAQGIPSFRTLVADDIPNLNASKINAGILPVSYGGTGKSSFIGNRLIFSSQSSVIDNAAKIYVKNDADAYMAINDTSIVSGYNFQVTGNSNFKGGARFWSTIELGVAAETAGQIIRVGRSSNWYNGRDKAIISMTSNTTEYNPFMSIRADGNGTDSTITGTWDIGVNKQNSNYQNELIFSYITDTVYDNETNTAPSNQIRFKQNGIVKASEFEGNLTGTASKATADANGNVITSTYKTKQTVITDSTGTAQNDTATRFIYSISQNENGEISVKTRALPILSITQGGTNSSTALTANRLMRSNSNGDAIVCSSNIYSDGSKLGVNTSSVTSGYHFEVNGSSLFKNNVFIGTGEQTDTNTKNIFVKNVNGAIALTAGASGARGLYDTTNNRWMLYYSPGVSNDSSGIVRISTWANKGSSSTPIYFNSNGEPTAITSALPVTLGGTGQNNTNNFVKVYTRSQMGDSINYDNPGVNGLFEARRSSEIAVTGKWPGGNDHEGYFPLLSLNTSVAMMQIAGNTASNYGWWIRGKQGTDVTLEGVDWERLVTNSGTWDINITGNAATATTAGGITSAGTTAQFWRGDNSWSNILAQPAETTLGINTSDLRIGRAIRTLHIATKKDGTGAGITDGDAAGITFGFSNAAYSAAYAGIYYQSSAYYGSRLYFATTDSFGNGAYARMMITHDGKVGIGTLSPSTRLHVEGDVTVTSLDPSRAVFTDANKKLVSADLYWANIKATLAASYNKTPEVANIKLNGNTSATAASTKNVQLVYDTSLEVLNFVFS